MTVALIEYGFVVALLTATGAWALESVCRMAGRPVRWVWAGGLVLTVVLVGVAPLRPPSISPPIPVVARTGAVAAGSPAALGQWQSVFVEMSGRMPIALDRYVAVTWLALSTLLLMLYAVVFL